MVESFTSPHLLFAKHFLFVQHKPNEKLFEKKRSHEKLKVGCELFVNSGNNVWWKTCTIQIIIPTSLPEN